MHEAVEVVKVIMRQAVVLDARQPESREALAAQPAIEIFLAGAIARGEPHQRGAQKSAQQERDDQPDRVFGKFAHRRFRSTFRWNLHCELSAESVPIFRVRMEDGLQRAISSSTGESSCAGRAPRL